MINNICISYKYKMETLQFIIHTYQVEIFLITFAILLILILCLFIQAIKMSKLNRKIKKIFKGENVGNIEELLLLQKKQIQDMKMMHSDLFKMIDENKTKIESSFSKSALYKYDAFSDTAGKLSFVYVLLNKKNSGIILNGIYSSNGHYLYVKEVSEGKTLKELSKEEKKTLNEAIDQ